MIRKHWLIFLFLLLSLLSRPALSAPVNEPDELLRRVRSMEERMKKIEANQQEVLDHQQKILAELDNLRIWIARR